MLYEDRTVALLSGRLALACGYSPDMAGKIMVAAALHDVGKNRIDRYIIEKPGKLTPQEMMQMKFHTIYGAVILSSIPGELGLMAVEIALFHHERWDGTGYWGYKASSLPKYIGIVSICDTYCALVFEREYKQAWTVEEALCYIVNQSGTQFCPDLVNRFVSLFSSDDNEGCEKSKMPVD